MNQRIILMQPRAGKLPQTLEPTSFADLQIQERHDLEEWIKNNPDILGERLLLIASEFDRFDKSDKRLDLLALDDDGRLVIIELKRNVAGSHADLQALRYAAFCSTMTYEDVAGLYAASAGIEREEARQAITEFVGDPNYAELMGEPRIILAAGSFDDPEITSCVLWLRKFRVDITCVEITPYRMAGDHIILVPRVLIPLPEAKDYLVRVERKQAEEGKQRKLTEEDLLEIARNRDVSPLLEISRRAKAAWNGAWESPTGNYGGSFIYEVLTKKGWLLIFGVNVSGRRKNTPNAQLDVWLRTKTLADAIGQPEAALRSFLKERFQLIAEEKTDCVLRLTNVEEAEALMALLQTWGTTSAAGGLDHASASLHPSA